MAISRAWQAALLMVLAMLPYLPPLLSQPLISDDYLQIHLGRIYGSAGSWTSLAADALYRCRATSILVTHWTELLFGVTPLAFYASGMLLHVACTWVLWVCAIRLGFAANAAFLGAAAFALYEGHQEAVMWYASLPELLLFLFCGLFVLSWLRWITSGKWPWYAAGIVTFALALLSKEPAVVLVPVAALLLLQRRARWQDYLYLLPMCLAAALYAWGIFVAKKDHLHLNDGTFDLHAPFVLTWARSMFRMFWFWGLLAVSWLLWRRRLHTMSMPAAWMALALLPYCFLLYMPHVPSRHVYLASAGLCLVIGAALADIPDRRWAAAIAVAFLLHNTGYVLIRKRVQFLERAEPTEQLLRQARSSPKRPLPVCNFPYSLQIAEVTLSVMLEEPPSSLSWNDPACNVGK